MVYYGHAIFQSWSLKAARVALLVQMQRVMQEYLLMAGQCSSPNLSAGLSQCCHHLYMQRVDLSSHLCLQESLPEAAHNSRLDTVAAKLYLNDKIVLFFVNSIRADEIAEASAKVYLGMSTCNNTEAAFVRRASACKLEEDCRRVCNKMYLRHTKFQD